MAARPLLASLAVLSALAAPATSATLDVVVQGVRNDAGEVRVAICAKSEFLELHCSHVGHAPAHPGDVTVRITGIPPGIWAAQAFHDEDGDGKIGRNLLGIPTEGLGFSNGARFNFGPPAFDAAAFQLGPNGGTIHFALRYF